MYEKNYAHDHLLNWVMNSTHWYFLYNPLNDPARDRKTQLILLHTSLYIKDTQYFLSNL